MTTRKQIISHELPIAILSSVCAAGFQWLTRMDRDVRGNPRHCLGGSL